MKKRIFFYIFLELTIMTSLTASWELWLEDIVHPLFYEDHVPESMNERIEYIITSFFFILIAISVPFTMIYKESKKREMALEAVKYAFDEIKYLAGLLPICANCKKIRDDEGYWHQVEDYIQKHSDATFSHGICPVCIQKLYPDYHKMIEEEKAAKEKKI